MCLIREIALICGYIRENENGKTIWPLEEGHWYAKGARFSDGIVIWGGGHLMKLFIYNFFCVFSFSLIKKI